MWTFSFSIAFKHDERPTPTIPYARVLNGESHTTTSHTPPALFVANDRDDVPRTNERNEPKRNETNRNEPNRRRDTSVEDARGTTDTTPLDSSRGRHPSHSSLDGWWGRDGGENCSLDYSRLRSSERSDDESDAKARREDDQGEI
jgi:hypothetical protein